MTKNLLVIALVGLLVYGAIEVRPLLVGPALSVHLPENGMSYEDGIVSVSGQVSRVASLTLDGASILPDQNGRFETVLAFPQGTSILTLAAADRFGRKVSATRTIYVP